MAQRSTDWRFALVFLLLGWAGAPPATADAPQVFEAEKCAAADAVIRRDAGASGGCYAAAPSDGFVLAEMPVMNKGTFQVWARYRGSPIVLRTADGKEIGPPGPPVSEWKWECLGTLGAEEGGKRLEVFVPFADKGEEKTSGVDMLALASSGETAAQLDALAKPADAAEMTMPDADVVLKEGAEPSETETKPVTAKILIDWNHPTRATSRRQFSLNIFGGYDPQTASNPQYLKNLKYMDPGLLRYHSMTGMMSDSQTSPHGWIDYGTKTWDGAKIGAALDPVPLRRAERLVCIGRWPPWMDQDKDGMLDPDQYDAFAKLCADLVRLLNVDQKRHIEYFEITNERDMTYWLRQMKNGGATQVAALADIYNRCAAAMKAVDPSIKTGGPAACRGDLLEPLKQFVILTKQNLDFLSYHAYASGNPSEPDASIYNKTETLGKTIISLRGMLDALSPGRHIELHLNEFNICYTHKASDGRMVGNEGAVFDALVFAQMGENGLDVGNAWNECDGTYGKMSRQYVLRPAAHVFHYFNEWLVGQAVAVSSDRKKKVVPFAVIQGKRRNWVLINRSSHANRAVVEFSGMPARDGTAKVAQIADGRVAESTVSLAELGTGVDLPPQSVTFYSLDW